ncbi:hypothetical protein IU486_29495 [Streptomyces gardneri]|jgi:hypothetical protein|uniref:hypothetical protein n=1 Tax=Nocardia TaxID=1817 RepID=UPI001356E868|nr:MULTISPECIES: hypothetical protein [Nocardia]MBF6168845.1 hypothetical protein [Streptomyces gardneri]MBF6208681.1 hypothetical protein [Streptomyces gardneri]UAK30846.1 hypothetical protein K8O92_23590 [Nocardia asteroides]
MGGRHRKDRERGRLDSGSVAQVTAAAECDPESATARSGFAARALAAQPEVPGWIVWLYEHAGEQLARLEYQMHYPLDYGGPDAYTSEEWLITQRAYLAERSARAAERARRFHRDRPGVVYAHGPELPDDEEFYDAFESGREWTGHWYSRDPVEAWGLSGVPA